MTETLEKKILIVDENKVNRRKVIKVLNRFNYNSKNGYKIKEEGKSSLAVERVEKEKYSLIIMAWVMKEMNGIQATEKIRKSGLETPIIIMSSGKDHLGVSKIGANAYINQNNVRWELPPILQKIYSDKKYKD